MLQLNKVHNIDCVEGLKQLEDNSIDLIVTSPPYNVGIDYDTWKDEMPWQDYLNWCKEWLTECFRVLKDDGRICINHYIAFSSPYEDAGQFPLMDFRNIMNDIGFNVHDTMIWHKPGCFNFGSNKCYKQSFEYMFVFSKGSPKSINFIRDVPAKCGGNLLMALSTTQMALRK